MNKTEILLVGTGAVGGYFCGKLSQSEAVTISALCRSDYEIVKKRGIHIKSYKGDFQFNPVKVVQKAEELDNQPDYILVCLKVLPEIDVASIISPVVGRHTSIALLQNGINIEQKVAESFPKNEIIGGIAFVAASREKPGDVIHKGSGKLTLGNYPKGISEKTKKLAQLFKDAGVPCDTMDEIVKGRWQKMVWNAAFNPMSVLGGRASSRQMVETPESEALARSIMMEVLEIAKADGHEISPEVAENAIVGNHKMQPFKTSMLVDYEMNRSMEIDAILGNALEMARKLGVSAPYLESIYGLMKLQEVTSKDRPD